jgi:hypothetical protein
MGKKYWRMIQVAAPVFFRWSTEGGKDKIQSAN